MAKQVYKTRKGRSKKAPSGPPGEKDPLALLGGGVGSTFAAATQNLVGTDFKPDEFLDDRVYGNILSTNKKYRIAKQEKVSSAFSRIVTAVAWLLKNGVPERQQTMASYTKTRSFAAILPGWRNLIKEHPHRWVDTDIFRYVHSLRGIMMGIDKATGGALSNALPDRFIQWSESEKILLPSEAPHKFLGLDLKAAYPHVKTLHDQSGVVVAEFCTPPYGWKIAIANNTRKITEKAGFAPAGFGDTIKGWATKEIYSQYLAKLHIIDHKLDFATLLPSLAGEADIGTAKSIMQSVLDKRDVATKVFGSEAVKDLGNLLKETRKQESKFDVLSDPGAAEDGPMTPASPSRGAMAALPRCEATMPVPAEPSHLSDAEERLRRSVTVGESNGTKSAKPGMQLDFVGQCDDAL